jgi:hypothetical protein
MSHSLAPVALEDAPAALVLVEIDYPAGAAPEFRLIP